MMAINMLTVIARKSITHDEFSLIPAGYYLVERNVHFIPEHPPLAKLIAAVPLMFLPLKSTRLPDSGAATVTVTDSRLIDQFWDDNRDLFDRITFWSRVPAILLTLGLGCLVFYVARDLYGAGPEFSRLPCSAWNRTYLPMAEWCRPIFPRGSGISWRSWRHIATCSSHIGRARRRWASQRASPCSQSSRCWCLAPSSRRFSWRCSGARHLNGAPA